MEVKYDFCIHIYAQMQMKRWHRWTVASAHSKLLFCMPLHVRKRQLQCIECTIHIIAQISHILLFERHGRWWWRCQRPTTITATATATSMWRLLLRFNFAFRSFSSPFSDFPPFFFLLLLFCYICYRLFDDSEKG